MTEALADPVVTRELRRYAVRPERFEAFIAWYFAGVPALRARYGFTVEWTVIDRAERAFIWLVSFPGDEAEFRAAEAAFDASAEFLAHLALKPASCLLGQRNSFVEPVVPVR